MSVVLAGRELAAAIRAETAARAAELTAAGRMPTLALVTATEDEASAWYVRTLARAAAKVGIACDVTDLTPAEPDRPGSRDATVESIRVALIALSENPLIHGIVLQTPLPGGARLAELAGLIDPAKDVDGANPVSLGRLMTGLPGFAPATAEAVLALLDHYEVALSGRRAVVVGRSAVVGKPVAQLLIARDATVTVCHSRTVGSGGRDVVRRGAGGGGGAGGADRAFVCGWWCCRGRRGDQRHGGRRAGRGRRSRGRGGRGSAQPGAGRGRTGDHGAAAAARGGGG